jgi:hypothetical protein
MSTFIREETTDRVVGIDLKEVLLLDRGAVKLLALSESNGAELRNCPAYIREWVTRERGGYRGYRRCLIRVTALTVIRKVQG